MFKVIQEDIDEIIEEFVPKLENLEGKTMLITGANGMIPSYIADTIAQFNKSSKNPCKLILYNRTPTLMESRLGHLLEDKNVMLLTQDIGNPFIIPAKADIILHAASRANPLSFKREPIDTINANANGTKMLLEYALLNNSEQFLFFSSSEVYGNPPDELIPTSESYFGNVNCLGDMACYAETKRFCETLCAGFWRQYGINAKIARIFHTFGPGLRNDGKTLADMFCKGIKNGKISLREPGLSKRAYSYVSDTARGILNILFDGKSGEAYNVGNDENYISVRDLAVIVTDVLQLKEKVEIPESYGCGERIKDRRPDITKLRGLGYSPKIGILDGLRRLRDYYIEAKVFS